MIKKKFIIRSDIKKMAPIIEEIVYYLRYGHVNEGIVDDVKLASQEAVINAIKHGNRFQEDLYVIVEIELSGESIIISVQDEGSGYDYNKVPDPTLDENISKGSGRGVFLIRKLMDKVHFNSSGNRIEMVKYTGIKKGNEDNA